MAIDVKKFTTFVLLFIFCWELFTFIFQTKLEYSEAYGLENTALTDAERRPQMGQINRPVRQPRLPVGMPGNDTASGSIRIPQEQMKADVPLGLTTRVPTKNQMSSRSTAQPRRDEREADEEIIYDVGIADYDNNDQSEAPPPQQVHPRAEAEADDEYEVPLSEPSKYMNIEENI